MVAAQPARDAMRSLPARRLPSLTEASMHRLLAALFLVIVLFKPTDASAAACNAGQSPFGDVPDGAIFCKEALWLRNALVTLGCGDGSNYCPSESVTRAQMALFMN